MILVLGSLHDAHALHVCHALREKGGAAGILDGSLFPGAVSISIDPTHPGEGSVRLQDGRRAIWREIRSVYWRQYSPVGEPALSDPDQARIAANDSRSLFESFLRSVPAKWVNGWDAYHFHQTKPAQLIAVAELDLPASVRLPRTYTGNDPEAVLSFAAAVGPCILKPVQGGAHTVDLKSRHLDSGNLENLKSAPVTIQEKIEGTDIRVFIAGERVLACSIQSDALDFRDDADARIVPVTLPDEVAESCVRIARCLHLVWTGIDLRRRDDGQYFFFEANPSPMFLGFEEQSGLPLSEALLALLME